MDDPRYPVGSFAPKGSPLTDDERFALIDAIAAHPARMRAAVSGLSDEQLETPYRDGGWTVAQVVHHVADSHLNSYARFKLAATEDSPTINAYDQAEWAEMPDAKTAPVESSLLILDGLHARWAMFLRGLSAEQCARTLDHPEIGVITIDFLIELYGWHGSHHEAHITKLRERMGW
jgi:uncharacterized damage-inducible protein DinB